MQNFPYYERRWLLKRYNVGPLVNELEPFACFLVKRGYSYDTGQRYIREIGRLSRWMEEKGIEKTQLNNEVIEKYLRFRQRSMQSPPKRGPYNLLLRHLSQSGEIAITTSRPSTPLARFVNEYIEHLQKNCGFAHETIRRLKRTVSSFLKWRFPDEEMDLSSLNVRDISNYLISRSKICAAITLGGDVSALRSLLRFLHFRGKCIEIDICGIPIGRYWRKTSLPVSLKPLEVNLLLDQCDCETKRGLRDFAVLLLLVRLGLRAVEVCALTLQDINWHSGYIIVKGKNRKESKLPLLKDIGQALANYLQNGRPASSSPHVFLRLIAPYQKFSSSCAVAHIVRRALKLAGLSPPHKGSHLLRHTCATQLLRSEATLPEIGQILRHRRVETTAIYAKVDLNVLRSLSLPWPKG